MTPVPAGSLGVHCLADIILNLSLISHSIAGRPPGRGGGKDLQRPRCHKLRTRRLGVRVPPSAPRSTALRPLGGSLLQALLALIGWPALGRVVSEPGFLPGLDEAGGGDGTDEDEDEAGEDGGATE
jgi:hypothetical protein